MTRTDFPTHGLYLALYVRDGILPSDSVKEDRYHWALLAIPSPGTYRPERAMRFHARNFYSSPDQTNWIYEEIAVDSKGTPKLLSQTFIGDVLDMDRVLEILRDVLIVQDSAEWNCVEWIRSVLDDLEVDGGAVEGNFNVWRRVGLWKEALGTADAETKRRSALEVVS
jgi:hypothetical protein